ncbi:hypothetical protein BJ138DRAFT_48492 [Hygrophoropsis aurantiaca]|uniref:Uncharacterized protein n=1 Tax=Hygrophoropsis aurantiaca TaxID=72124 RepID=A0ACB8ACQ3_9AGAM|nr:hypothetical protein BJ138DRAFT_48492 [Hygrophoropsis aurantiaca]
MSYSPNESSAQLFAEGTWLQGAIVTSICYGVVLVLYLMCFQSLWRRIHTRDLGRTQNIFFLIYVTFIFALGTIYMAFNAQITQMGFINNREYPGGPADFESNTSSPPLNSAFVISNWCADAMMIWRCIVVYRDSRLSPLVILFGGLMLLASVVTGCLWLVIVSSPAQDATGWMSFSFLFPYLSVSLAINVIISILTAGRLLYHRRRILHVLGPGHGALYTSFAAMIVESAAVYSVVSLLYLIPYAVNSPLANAFMQILGEAQIIAPLLIIYRVAEGKAWSRNHTTQVIATSVESSLRMRRLTQAVPASSPHTTGRSAAMLDVTVNFDVSKSREGSIKFVNPDCDDVSAV